ncbi:MAG: response regulator [Opitutaceae bacterium]|nr:response regulator [Cephaloticoccus sp.]MCP5530089.1 response regulator [Opitutaceae bacterium]
MEKRVLVLEDQQLLRDLLCGAIGGLSGVAEVGGAATLAEARAWLARVTAVDLVVLDLELPDGHGMELLAEAAVKNARVVIVTGGRDAANAREALLRGVAPLGGLAWMAFPKRLARIRSTRG